MMGLPRAQPAGIRIRGIQSLAVAKVAFATDRQMASTANAGFRYKSAHCCTGPADPATPICNRCDRWRHDAALIQALQSWRTCPIRAVIARLTQTGHSAQRGRARGARPPDGVDRAVILSPRFRRAAVAAVAALAIDLAGNAFGSGGGPLEFLPRSLPPAAIWPPGTRAVERDAAAAASYYRAALRGDPATTSFSAAPSWRCWRMARSTRRSSSPSAFCRSTRPTASPGSCSACARSSRSSIRSRAGNSPSRSAARSPISPRRLLAAWTMASPTEVKAATDSIDKLAGPDWYAIFKDLHCRADPRSRRPEEGRRPSASSAPTSSTPPRCAWCRAMAVFSRGREIPPRR